MPLAGGTESKKAGVARRIRCAPRRRLTRQRNFRVSGLSFA